MQVCYGKARSEREKKKQEKDSKSTPSSFSCFPLINIYIIIFFFFLSAHFLRLSRHIVEVFYCKNNGISSFLYKTEIRETIARRNELMEVHLTSSLIVYNLLTLFW